MRTACIALLLFGLCVPHARGETPADAPALAVDGSRFVDGDGREVVLRGFNAGSKDPRRRYEPHQSPEDFENAARWGLNCIRLLIFWDGVEPEPGEYDEAYLDMVAERVAWAHEAGLFVILDMHQDLYSHAIPGGNGAPAWATLTGDAEHVRDGGAWSTAYYTSPMLHAAFDNFWANAPGPDGVGIQDRFARAWGEVARRFADTPGVIGYDLLNEPFLGGAITGVIQAVMSEVPGILDAVPPDVLTSGGFGEVLSAVLAATDDAERYPLLIQAVERLHAPFEAGPLADMHRRAAEEIRKHDPARIIFIQPGFMSNSGAVSHVPPIVYDDGTRDPQQAYAPHTYDLVVDTDRAHDPSPFRLETIFANIAAHTEGLAMPVLSGEWGAFYGNDRCRDAARMMVAHFEAHAMGDLYWDFHEGVEDTAYFEMIRRPYPVAVAGALAGWRLDPETGVFECSWREDPAVGAPTRIYVCDQWFGEGHEVTLEPEGAGYQHVRFVPDSVAGHLVIEPTGEAVTRTLRFQPPTLPGENAE